MSTELVDRVRRRLAGAGSAPDTVAVADAVRAEAGGAICHTDVLGALRLLRHEFVGAGPLEPLLADPGTTDVLVTAPDSVWVDGVDGLRRTDVGFADEESVRRLATRLAQLAGRRLDDAQPYVDGWLPGAGPHGRVRLHAVLPPVAAGGTCLSLRVLRPAVHDLKSLRELGTFDQAGAALLEAVLTARLAFLVTGSTGSGKSTLLSAMLGAVGCTPARASAIRPADRPSAERRRRRRSDLARTGAAGTSDAPRQIGRRRGARPGGLRTVERAQHRS